MVHHTMMIVTVRVTVLAMVIVVVIAIVTVMVIVIVMVIGLLTAIALAMVMVGSPKTYHYYCSLPLETNQWIKQINKIQFSSRGREQL